MIVSSTDAYAHGGGGGNQGGGNNNGGGNDNGGNNGGGNNNDNGGDEEGNGNGDGNGGDNGNNGGDNGEGDNGNNGNGEDEGGCTTPAPVAKASQGASGQIVPQCPLCKYLMNYTDNIRAYEWTSPQGGKQVRQFYLCPQCGFNNQINAQGDVLLNIAAYQLKLNSMVYKKFNGITLVPDYAKFKLDMPKQTYPVSLPYAK
jgi:hypothetical protein